MTQTDQENLDMVLRRGEITTGQLCEPAHYIKQCAEEFAQAASGYQSETEGQSSATPPLDLSDDQRVDTTSKFLSRKLRSAMDQCGHSRADPALLQRKMMVFMMDIFADRANVKSRGAMEFLAGACTTLQKLYKDREVEGDEGESWDAWNRKVTDWVDLNLDQLCMPPS
ncbi:hypothetical protein PG999_014321 [Apiospora kogelbergensis]|uniref:Uncharacterized protein n=1 Tax=Apiospora kogelbergensis TaxID=1337665 RepID=A0AAW0Q2Z7_9PEZI